MADRAAILAGRGPAAALPWRTILVAAALVVALAAALALVAGGPRPTPLGMTGNVAIVLRQPDGAVDTVDVIAVGADGTERLVRRFEPGDLGAGRRALPYGEVSLDGWFALALGEDNAASGSFALLRLDDPARPPVFVDYVPVFGGAWSPTGGQFATTTPLVMECCAITVTDATTGRSQDLGDLVLPSGGHQQDPVGTGRVGDRRAGRSHRPLGDLVADRGAIRRWVSSLRSPRSSGSMALPSSRAASRRTGRPSGACTTRLVTERTRPSSPAATARGGRRSSPGSRLART